MRKLLSIMLALVIALTSMSAWAMPAADTKVTIDFVNQSPDKILKEIGRQSGLNIVYKTDDAKKWGKITIKATNQPAEEVIGQIAAKTGEEYSIKNNIVVFGKKQGRIDALVHGIVVDETGEPLPGATVILQGTSNGTSTNIDGEFALKVDSESPILQVTYVGMKASLIALTSKNTEGTLKITLEPNVAMMDEVVVTGYQNIKRENATGAYTIISSDELEKRHTANLVNNLEGNIPGVVKQQEGRGKTGEDLLTIRGQGTFEARTAPLIVVDGLPIEGGLNTVNPYEVQSITVLKDASAAAIYGARASNGVIVITTKSARKEKVSVDFNADITITDKLNYNKSGLASAAQTIQLERLNWDAMRADDDQSSFNTMLNNWKRGGFYAQGISQVKRLLIGNYLGEISDSELNSTLDTWSRNDYRREWQDAIKRSRVNQQYNVALRTQGKIVNSNIVLNYNNDNMGMSTDYSRSLQFRYRGDINIAKWFDLAVSVNVISQRSKSDAGNGTGYGDYNAFAPYQSMFNADGTLAPMEAGCILNNPALSNPDYELKDHSYNLIQNQGLSTNKDRYTNIRSYIHADFKLPVEGWKASAQFQYEDIQQQYESLYDKNSYMMRDIFNLYTTVDRKEVWVDDPYWDWEDWDGDWDHYEKKPVMMN